MAELLPVTMAELPTIVMSELPLLHACITAPELNQHLEHLAKQTSTAANVSLFQLRRSISL